LKFIHVRYTLEEDAVTVLNILGYNGYTVVAMSHFDYT
jgi:hypothetical protein